MYGRVVARARVRARHSEENNDLNPIRAVSQSTFRTQRVHVPAGASCNSVLSSGAPTLRFASFDSIREPI